MFRIAAAPDRDRREPTLTGAPRLVSPDPSRLAPPERLTPIADRERARWLGPIISLVLHLLPLLLLIEWPMAAPPETEPIAGAAGVRTAAVPAAPPPQPVPPKPEFKPPPPGRIASEDIGDTEMKEASREPSDQPAAKDTSPPPPPEKTEAPPPPPEKTEPPPESPQQTAAIVPPPPPEKANAPQAAGEAEPERTTSAPLGGGAGAYHITSRQISGARRDPRRISRLCAFAHSATLQYAALGDGRRTPR